MSDSAKMNRLLIVAERLIGVFEADIAALEAGKPKDMASLTPENQQLIAAYGREAQSLTREALEQMPPPQRQQFTAVAGRFKDTLARHTRMVTRVKNASEGLIRAVASEVDKRRTRARPYDASGAAPGGYGGGKIARPASSALIVNAVA